MLAHIEGGVRIGASAVRLEVLRSERVPDSDAVQARLRRLAWARRALSVAFIRPLVEFARRLTGMKPMTDIRELLPRYDAIVVGARCAGAATALLLARGGARVLVLERDAAGADTLSTHALMRGAVMQLARWGVLPRIVAAGTPPVRRTSFAYGPERIDIDIREGHGVDALYAPRRTVLDPALVAEARAAGAEFRFNTAVQGLLRSAAGRVAGVEAVTADRRRIEIRTGIVVGADGRRSTVARQVGARAHVTGAHAAAAIYAYVAGLADRGNRWHYAPGLSAGAIPTNGGLTCIFASVSPKRYRDVIRRDLTAGFEAVLREADPALAAEVAAGLMRHPPRRLRWRAGLSAPEPRARLGAGRRRGLFQGPDHRAWDNRRAARRRDPRPRGGGGRHGGARPLPGGPRRAVAAAVPHHRRNRRARLGSPGGTGAAPGAEPCDEGRAGLVGGRLAGRDARGVA